MKVEPTRVLERLLAREGYKSIVGIDEVGRGSWAGPLMMAAVHVPLVGDRPKVRDSKQLSPKKRQEIFSEVKDWTLDWAIGSVSHAECDAFGMSEALRIAATRALAGLREEPDHIVLDGKWNFLGKDNVTMMVQGDAHCVSLASASILAKVIRDNEMCMLDASFPAYNFYSNKGYPCWRHRTALAGYGLSSIHRRSWKYVATLPWNQFANEKIGDRAPSDARVADGKMHQVENQISLFS